ncbi:MAG: hypothetical protein R3E91_03200 [Chlamydiales bacterium]
MESTQAGQQVNTIYLYGLPPNSQKEDRDKIFFEVDKINVIKKISILIKLGKLNSNLLLSSNLSDASHRIVRIINQHRPYLLPSYPIYQSELEIALRVRGRSPKQRCDDRVYIVVCALLAKIYGLSEDIKRKAFEEYAEEYDMFSLFESQLNQTKDSLEEISKISIKFNKNMFNFYYKKLFISFYNQIDQQYSNLNDPASVIWQTLTPEEKIQCVDKKIDEMLNALPEESPERTDLLKIKMMIEAGYIFKDGDVISKKSTDYALEEISKISIKFNKNMFNFYYKKLFISFYNQIDQQYSNLNNPASVIWQTLTPEEKIQCVDIKIDEMLNALPEESPERTDLLKIKMMIEAGYIFKDGDVISKKSTDYALEEISKISIKFNKNMFNFYYKKLFISFYNQIDQQYSNLNNPASVIWQTLTPEEKYNVSIKKSMKC